MKKQLILFDLWDTVIQNKSYKQTRIQLLHFFLASLGMYYPINNITKAYSCLKNLLTYAREEQNNQFVGLTERLDYIVYQITNQKLEINWAPLIDKFQEVVLEDQPLIQKTTIDTIQKLSDDSYLCVVSDTGFTTGKTLLRILNFYNLDVYFEHYIFSEDIGRNKPHDDMFTIRNEYNGIPCYMIGDKYGTDIIGAIHNNIYGIQINCLHTELTQNYAKVKDLSNAYKLLKTLAKD